MDTEELFDENMLNDEGRLRLEKLSWTKNSITYKFNDQGFRSDEFDDTGDSIVFLGCSHTVGIGMSWDNTFSKIVSDTLKLKCFNLGRGGGSMDSCFRFAYYWLEKLKPKIVVILNPSRYRKELIKTDSICYLSPNRSNKYEEFYRDWLLEEQNVNMSKEKNSLAIEFLANKISSKFISLEFNNDDGKARDLSHGGLKWHNSIAKTILERIK
jgi:hypothetical protein